MANVHRLLVWMCGAVAVVLFGLPALHYAVFGSLPRGCSARQGGSGRGTVPGESRPRRDPERQEGRETLKAETVHRASAALLRRARSRYSGLIGTGFTNLVDRMPAAAFQPAAHAAILDVSGFDFLTVNPHPDPGMEPDRLLSYAEASVREARRIAGRCGVRKVLLGAVMVRSGSGELQGFINPELRAYSPQEEKDFYSRLFDRTWDLLDGMFLDFGGWEERPAVEVIRGRFGSGGPR